MGKRGKSATDAPTGGEATEGPAPIRLAEHPAAARSIPRVRAWAGLVAFVASILLGEQSAVPFVDLIIRSVAIGTIAALVAWAVAQAVWKQIVFSEIAAARKRAVEAQQALLNELEQRDTAS